MKPKKKIYIPSKYALLFATLFCIVLIFLTISSDRFSGPINTAANYTIVPMQKGINKIGTWISEKGDYFKSLDEALAENEKLQQEVDDLTIKNTYLQQDKYELARLQELFELSEKYPDYEKVGARIISDGSGNWFNTFIIDKGSKDGIEPDMNVIAGSGLVGIVTEVGSHWATVRSIIDDTSNVNAVILTTQDRCFVQGDLQLMNDGVISFSQLANNENQVKEGDQILTSPISDLYLDGILIGYVSQVKVDPNNLTRSGYITPAVDFSNLQEVLVIKELKRTQVTDE